MYLANTGNVANVTHSYTSHPHTTLSLSHHTRYRDLNTDGRALPTYILYVLAPPPLKYDISAEGVNLPAAEYVPTSN